MSFNTKQSGIVSDIVKPISLKGWKAREILHLPAIIFAVVLCWVVSGFAMAPSLWKLYKSQSWIRTPCVIENSWAYKSGDVYKVQIKFSYCGPDGETYVAKGYKISALNYKTKGPQQRIVDRFPPGSTNHCYVNPKDPSEAILRRSVHGLWVLTLIAVTLSPLALIGSTWLFLWRKKDKILREYWQDVMKDLQPVAAGKAAHGKEEFLKPYKPETGVMVMLGTFLAAFVIWAFVDIAEVFGASTNRALLIIGVFALPCTLGLAYYLIRYKNPIPEITVPHPIRQGAPFTVRWRYESAKAPTTMSMNLEGREKVWWGPIATYGATKQNAMRSRTTPFTHVPVYDSADSAVPPEGSKEVTVPLDTMHSLDGHRNAIMWKLILETKTEGLPGLSREYPIIVLPAAFFHEGSK